MKLTNTEMEVLTILKQHPYIMKTNLFNMVKKLNTNILESLIHKNLIEEVSDSKSKQIMNQLIFRPNSEPNYKITGYGIQILNQNK